MSKYSVVIGESDNGDANPVRDIYVTASGSLKLVTLAAKEGLAEIEGRDGEFFARIAETETVDGAEKRSLVRLTATSDIIKMVVTQRLKNEKSEQAATPTGAAGAYDAAANADAMHPAGG